MMAKKKKKALDPSLLPFYLPGATTPSVTMIEATTDWSKFYLDYMNNRETYWGQDAALFADAWVGNLQSVLNIGNMGKATIQGTIGWKMGLYSTLTVGILTEIVVDVLVLTTAITIVDPTDQHNWGLDDLSRGYEKNWGDELMSSGMWKNISFGSVVS
jgi:hypothetical protein